MRRFVIGALIATFSLATLNCSKDSGPFGPSIPDPVASFSESGGTVTPATISFQNTSQNADAYTWHFGDGDSSTITNPTHVYYTYDDYLVVLIASNTSTGRTASKSQTISITPSTVYVEAIIIDDIPFTDEYGSGWDLTTGPDLYPDFVRNSDLVYTCQSYYYPDAAPSDLPIQWTLSYQITNWTSPFFVEAWDYDDMSGDDYIGSTNGFRINDVIQSVGYTSTISLQNTSGTIQARVSLRWE